MQILIPYDTHSYPPSLLELDSKLTSLLKSIHSRGGVVNSCVVKATALALVYSNNISGLTGFEPKNTWVKCIYRRCNFTCQAGTTTCPLEDRLLIEEGTTTDPVDSLLETEDEIQSAQIQRPTDNPRECQVE